MAVAFPMASPLASPCARRAEDVAPYHVCAAGPTSKIRSDLILEVFVAFPMVSPAARVAVAFPMAFPLASPCARRAEDVAPYHVCVVRAGAM